MAPLPGPVRGIVVREFSEAHSAFGVEGKKLLHQFRQRIVLRGCVLATDGLALSPLRREEEGFIDTPICRAVTQLGEPRGTAYRGPVL